MREAFRKAFPTSTIHRATMRVLGFVFIVVQFQGMLFGQGGPFRVQTDVLPAGTVGTAYSQTFTAAGTSTPPYTWVLAAGTLPPGLTLAPTGVLAGVPTTAGTYDFTVRVTDSRTPAGSAQKAFSLLINPRTNPLSITTGSPLPSGIVGTSYSLTFAATGGTTPYRWSVASGSLPAGLTLSNAGVLSGTPTSVGTFNFTVRATDSGLLAQTDNNTYNLTINPAIPPISITTASPLPTGNVGAAYSQTLAATGGTPAYTWSLASGNLPPGLSISSGGVLSGVPTTTGTYNFTVRVADTQQHTAQKALALTINPVANPLSITTTSPLPSGIVGTAYSQTFSASGGTTPYRWTIRSGSLPQGLTLSTDGRLSGTPSGAGSSNFTVEVTDSGLIQQTSNRAFALTISNPTTIPTMSLSGFPTAVDPTQQVPLTLILSAAHPVALSGTLTIAFAPNAAGTADDPMVMFSNSSRSVGFNFPANSTVAVFQSPVLLLTGTVAGRITLTATVQGSAPQVAGNVNVRTLAPQIRNVVATRTSGGLRVEITAYSPERRVQQVNFTFRVRTEAGTQSVSLQRNVDTDFANWYSSSAAAPFGSSFVFMQSFVVDGDLSTIEAVTVTLSNTQGSTASNLTAFSN
jgi:large repetitive protein